MAPLTAVEAARSGRSCTFRVTKYGGVWQVTRDGVFYGDFLSRPQALRCACDAARTFDASGGVARVIAPPADSVVPHQLAPR
jgi:hypothetical protein